MTIRVAITGISGDVGLGAIHGLRAGSPANNMWLLGLDASEGSPGQALVDAFVRLPPVADPEYVDALISAMRAHAIDVLLPGIDSEIILLSRQRDRFRENALRVALAPADLVEAADDKLETAAYVTSRGLNAPATCSADEPCELGFPVVAKPRRGQGSRGVVKLDDADGLHAFLGESRPGYCLQRYIEGPEITVGFLYDWDGVLRDAIAMERSLECGRTARGTVVRSREMLNFIEEFGAKIRGAGAINAQLRIDPDGVAQIFEINARLSGSTAMRVAVGFNDPLRIVTHLVQGIPMERFSVYDATVYRRSSGIVVKPNGS